MAWLYDTHVHLSDSEYAPYLNVVLQNMARMCTKACCVSMDLEDSQRTMAISRLSDMVVPFVGIHPEKSSEDLDGMIQMIEENRDVGGIGEIGLDPTFCDSDEDYTRQKMIFERLLSAAEERDKPVSIHSRQSLDEVLSILGSYSLNGACLHWFDGNKKQLRRAMEMDLFVSYGPVTVYANDKQGLLARTDPSKMLVETDGPVRFSRCFQRLPAQVAFLPSVIFTISMVLNLKYDVACSILEANSRRFLGI